MNSPTLSETIPFNGISTGYGSAIWWPVDWFTQFDAYGTQFSSTWNLALDLADATASYPFYLGRRIIVNPFVGLRGAWIRQSLIMAMAESSINQFAPLGP